MNTRAGRLRILILVVAFSLLAYLGYSALRSAYLRYEIHEEIEYNAYDEADRVRGLLDAGADIEDRDASGDTPLIQAIGYGHTNIVHLLLSRGARVNVRNNDGTTPLLEAAATGHPDFVRELLSRGADVRAKDNHGKTALDWAVSNVEFSRKNDPKNEWGADFPTTIALLKAAEAHP